MTDANNQNEISYLDVVTAYQRINPILTKTPVHASSTVDKLVGKSVYFKCENLQKTGSFKVRGALNAVLAKMSRADNVKKYEGCITHSSGNHGIALAWACKYENIPCTIVIPHNTPQVKIDAIQSYNATIAFCEPNPISRMDVCKQISSQQNRLIVNPFDDYDVIAGQGTVAYEFLEQVPQLDAILVTVSGGGLISGISLYAKKRKPSIRIFAVEPEGKNLAKCLQENNRNPDNKQPAYLNTIAESIRTEQCGQLTFPIMSNYIQPDDVFTVTDEEMIDATKFIFKRMKLVVELAAGAAVAAAMSNKMKTKYPNVKNLGVILCGGNIDVEKLPW